mgnify:CR=1 FL=1
MEYVKRFVGEKVKRSLSSDCFYGETYTAQGVLLGFSASGKAFYISQETDVEICLPVKLLSEDSLFNLKRAELNKVFTFDMATKMCKKLGLKIINGDDTTKEVVMTNTNESFEITEEEVAPIDTSRLTVAEVNKMLNDMGKIHDFLRDESYVVFSMSGSKMMARVLKSHCIGDYIQK